MEGKDVHHMRDVLRLAPGSVVDAVTPDGMVLTVRIETIGPSVAEGTVLTADRPAGRPKLVVCHGVSKGVRVDLVVQKVSELGAARFVPFFCARSVVRLDATKGLERRERWRRVASEAAKQCGRADVMDVAAPIGFDGLEGVLAGGDPAIVLWESATTPLGDVLAEMPGPPGALVIGPEGGLEEREVERLLLWGARAASLGALTLRTETAAIVATAIVGYEAGWLGKAKKT